jgi:hypothetical protein
VGRTPDRTHGVSDEEGIVLSDEGVLATQVGEVRYKGAPHNRFSMYDATGEFDPNTAAGSGITASQHKALLDLIHLFNGPADGWPSGAEEEITTPGPFPDVATWYKSSGRVNNKIVDQTVTYNGNKTIATEVWRLYAADGFTVLVTLTDTHTYTGIYHQKTVRTWA